MQQTIGALAALVVLLALIVGPIYVAVSSGTGVAAGPARCAPGDISCDVGALRASRE